MGPGIFTFSRACFNFVSKLFETTEIFGLSQFSSCFSPFQFFPYIIHCFSVSKHQKWGLVFSLFPDLVSILFRNVSKQLKHLDLVNFLPVSVRGARWLSGRVSDSGARGPGFETYRRRVVSLSKTLYSPKVLVNYPGTDGSVPT